jgi:hypothetical protein
MVEVVVRENLDKAYVLRAPGRLPQIHISAEMHIDLIKEHGDWVEPVLESL